MAKFSKKVEILINYIFKLVHYFTKMGVPLFINFYGAKVLEPKSFGNIVYLLTSISIINLFSNFGISNATSKYAAEKFSEGKIDQLKKLFSSTSIITLLSLPVLIVVFLVLFKDKGNVIYYCIPFIVFSPLTSILDGLYSGVLLFRRLALLTILPSALAIIGSYYFINAYKEYGIIMSYSAYYVILFLLYFLGFPYKSFKTDKKISLNVFKYAAIIGLGSMSYFLYSRMDIIILKNANYVVEIAYYEIVMRGFELIMIPVVMSGQVVAPYFIKLKTDGRFNTIKKYVNIATLGVFILGVMVAFLCYIIFPFILQAYFPKYHTAEFLTILNILLLTIPLKFMGVFLTNGVITPLGYAKIVSYTTLVFGVLNVVLDFLFIKLFGFVGVFYATFIIHNMNIALQYVLFRVQFKKDDDKQDQVSYPQVA